VRNQENLSTAIFFSGRVTIFTRGSVYGGTLGGLGQALGKAAREGMVGKAGRGRFFFGPAQKPAPSPKGKQPIKRPKLGHAQVAGLDLDVARETLVKLHSCGLIRRQSIEVH
jgi:hypothetical protein